MTTMLGDAPFFGVPKHVVKTGLWARMKGSEKAMYTALLFVSERHSSRQFKLKDIHLEHWSGVKRRTIREARIKIQEYGLIKYSGKRGEVYVYTICDPRTGEVFPGDPRWKFQRPKKP